MAGADSDEGAWAMSISEAKQEGQRAVLQALLTDDELAAFHSITSSGRASSVAGTSRPSALAVLGLIASSYLQWLRPGAVIPQTMGTLSLADFITIIAESDFR
jgi:hypothetical protein